MKDLLRIADLDHRRVDVARERLVDVGADRLGVDAPEVRVPLLVDLVDLALDERQQ